METEGMLGAALARGWLTADEAARARAAAARAAAARRPLDLGGALAAAGVPPDRAAALLAAARGAAAPAPGPAASSLAATAAAVTGQVPLGAPAGGAPGVAPTWADAPSPGPAAGDAGPPAIPGLAFERRLGRGGMGEVWLAREVALDRPVAVKLVDARAPAAFLARFEREAGAAGRLSHPGVVRVLRTGVAAGGRPFLVMEFVEGPTLEQVLARAGPLEPRRAATLAAAVADALAHAHAAGVLHRDLKPANILLAQGVPGAAERPVLTDFGLAADASASSLTRTGEMWGTPGYMPPEQVEGLRCTDARSDVYGLGATLFALLTGRAPFEAGTPLATTTAVLRHPPPPPSRLRPGLDPALDALVLRCLAKDPGERPPTAAALAADLRAWLGGEAPAGSAAPAGRRRAGVALGLGVVAVVGVTGAAAAWRAPPPGASPPPPAAPLDPAAAAEALAAQGRLAQAWAVLDAARGGAQGDLALRRLRARLALAGGDGATAAACLAGVDTAVLTPADLAARARARWLAQDVAGALGDLDALLAAAPATPSEQATAVSHRLVAAELRRLRGDRAGAIRDAEAALALLGGAAKVDPRRARALLVRALARCDLERLLSDEAAERAALADLDAAERAGLPSWEGLTARARVRAWTKHDEEARALADRAVAAPNAGPEALLVRATLRLSRIAQEDEVRAGSQALGVGREFGVDAAARAEAIAEIRADCEEAARRSAAPRFARPWRVLVQLEELTADADAVARAVDALLAVDPDDPGGLVRRAQQHVEAGRLDAAAADLERAAARDPADPVRRAVEPELRLLRARVRLADDPASALVDLDQAVATASRVNLASTLVARGWCRLALGDAAGAAADAEEATATSVGRTRSAAGTLAAYAAQLRTYPEDAAVQALVGRTLERLRVDDARRAAAAIERAGTLAPTPEVLLLRAKVRLLERDRQGVLEDCARVLAARPDQPDALLVRARAELTPGGDRRQAVTDLERVLAVAPPRSPIRLQAAELLRRLDARPDPAPPR